MIEAEGLTMRYGSVEALKDATFAVAKGQVAGLLGPNGAGKSTTMKILTTFLVPTAGTARVGGFSVTDEPLAVRRVTGYLPESLPLYMDMEAGEYVRFVARARGLSGKALADRTGWVEERCGLRPVWRKPVRELSKGYRQRTALAQALVHDPAVVILDEPTSGLDPHQILEIRGLVRELAAERTVILSTHILQEAEAMADRIVIIDRGRIAGQGSVAELERQAGGEGSVVFSVKARKEEAEAALRTLGGVKVRSVRTDGGECRFDLSGADAREVAARAGALAREKGWTVVELTPRPMSLETAFLALTEADRKAV